MPNVEMGINKAVREYLLTDHYHYNHSLLSLNYPAETMLSISCLFHFSLHINPKWGFTDKKTETQKGLLV